MLETIKYFFSYSRKDSEFVIKLANDLKKEGASVWLDQIDIAPGKRWDDAIQNALNEAKGLLVALSTFSIKSENVMDEVSYAINQGKQIVPLILENCEVPFRLARFQHIDFTSNYEVALRQLQTIINANQTDCLLVNPDLKAASKTPPNEKLHLKSRKSEIQENEISLKTLTEKNVSKLKIGFLCIVSAVLITLFNKCPTNAQYFIIYALIGIGIALLFVRSAKKSAAKISTQNVVLVLSGGVALPFILFFTNPIGSFKQDDCNVQFSQTSATVFVHGKKSKQDIVLREMGHVIMDVNGERKRESINEKGQAIFQNLNVGDSVRIEIDFSEPYKSVTPDSVYVIQWNNKIYLPVALLGLGKVEGMVLFNESTLAGVIVKLKGGSGFLLDTTDQTGGFSISIPEKMQTNKYPIWFIKEGFKTKSTTAFPQTGESLNIIMEKM